MEGRLEETLKPRKRECAEQRRPNFTRNKHETHSLCSCSALWLLLTPSKQLPPVIDAQMAALKAFAKAYDAIVIVLSQLNNREDNVPPTLAHLKESGGIGAAADVVVLTYRPKSDHKFTGEDKLIVAKQRNGDIGFADVVYNTDTLTFRARQ